MKIKWLMKQVGTAIWNNRSNIEFVVGTGLVVVGTGMAMAKAEDAVEEKHKMEYAIKAIELKDEHDDWDSEGQRTKACLKMAKDTAVGYGKVYAVPLGIEAAGLVLMGISHATDRSELAATGAALASVTSQFLQYRQRVIEDQGEEKDEIYLTGAKAEVVVNEDGSTTEVVTPKKIPDHSFLFDESNPNWEKEGFMNRDFLSDHELWINDRLWNEGVLTENDILRDVGAPYNVAAAQGDWGITAVDDEGNRNYISFGINKNTERAKAFREGNEKSFLVILNNMEPNISKKLYRLNKYHKDIQITP